MSGFGQTQNGVFAIGDSKTAITPGFMPELLDLLNYDGGFWWLEAPARVAVSGATAGTIAGIIDAELAARTEQAHVVIMNLGVNDIFNLAPGNTNNWVGYMTYILDAVHAKYPLAKCYLMRPWYRAGDPGHTSMMDDELIPGIVASRSSWCELGPDERVFLEGGDDGYTYTVDGVHPNNAGWDRTATNWWSIIRQK